MRLIPFIVLVLLMHPVHAQRPDPDQHPYWTRYTIVEDSSELIPLKGDYRVYYLQSGMWWSYMIPEYPIRNLPAVSTRLLPLFSQDRPAFKATPARGLDYPEVRLVVVRDPDTMVVELTTYFIGMSSQVTDRCAGTDCRRRPPVVLPFRPGRYMANGSLFGQAGADNADPRTAELTLLFDTFWREAMKADDVVPQLNTDTCRQDLLVPADLDLPGTNYRDAWALRSAYCGTHFFRFPSWGAQTEYVITFNPYVPEVKKDPVTIAFRGGDDPMQWMDMTDWPVGDHAVRLLACGNGGTFTLKLR